MADPVILPQYQGDYYSLQRKQALAQALMQKAIQGQAQPQMVGSGDFNVMPKVSPLSGIAQLGEALLASKMNKDSAQGMRQLGQQQWGTLFPMMGGSQSPQPSAGTSAGGAGAPTANSGVVDPAGNDATAGQPSGAGMAPQQYGAGPVTGSMNPLGMDPRMATMMYLSSPDEYYKAQAAAYAPTDLQKSLRAAGIDPNSALGHQIIQQNIAKQNYVEPVTSRPGTILRDPYTMKPVAFNPNVPEGTNPLFDASGNVVGVQGINGVGDAIRNIKRAQTAGEGDALPYSGVDANGNPLPVTTRTNAVTQGQDTSDTLRILQGEKQDILARPDSDPRKAVDLAAINNEISRWEKRGAGKIYAEAPMGAKVATDVAQGAPSKNMADSYQSMSTADANYQQSRESLNEMLSLANNKGLSGGAIGALPEGVATRISPDAAKYQKLHATYVALQGKALGGGGTDAARATINDAVPTYDKPQSAMVSGLKTQLNNLDLAHMKTQFLSPIYQRGDEKTFTQQSAAFDQNITPSMISALGLSGEQQRSAIKAAIQENPSLRPKFEWAFNNGLIK